MTSLESQLEFWEAVAQAGFIAVIGGVIGEGVEFIKEWREFRATRRGEKPEEKKSFLVLMIGTLSFVILVAGLAVEFWGASKASVISHLIISQANREAGQANERAANVESTNLVLRAKVAGLEAILQPRAITEPQRDKFLNIVKDFPKETVGVFVGSTNYEADSFAYQIRCLLNEAGYCEPGEAVIRREEMRIKWSLPYPWPNGVTFAATPVYFLMFATNTEFFSPSVGTKWTNSWPGMTLISENTFNHGFRQTVTFNEPFDPRAVPGMVFYAFQSIGISVQFIGTTNRMKPGEWGILVSPKLN